MKKFVYILLLFNFIETFAQEKSTILGDWEPQTLGESCWAATLANVSKPKWKTQAGVSEQFYLDRRKNRYGYCENLDSLSKYANIFYNYRIAKDETVLSWSGIQSNIDRSSPRPMLYSFRVENDLAYHMVNIYGYEKLAISDERFNKWLYVYDPKPDRNGNHYLKNFLTYQLISPLVREEINMQGTLYQITSKRTTILNPIPNATESAVLSTSFNNCVPKSSIIASIKSISDNMSNDFRTKVGLTSRNFAYFEREITVSNFEQYVNLPEGVYSASSDTAEYQMVSQNSVKSYIIPLVEVDQKNRELKFLTGVAVRNTKDGSEECLVIDTFDDLDFLNEIPDFTELLEWENPILVGSGIPMIKTAKNIEIITDKYFNRFVQIDKHTFDMDNAFKGGKRYYKNEEFYQNLLYKQKINNNPNLNFNIVEIPKLWNQVLDTKYGIKESYFKNLKERNTQKVILPTKKL